MFNSYVPLNFPLFIFQCHFFVSIGIPKRSARIKWNAIFRTILWWKKFCLFLWNFFPKNHKLGRWVWCFDVQIIRYYFYLKLHSLIKPRLSAIEPTKDIKNGCHSSLVKIFQQMRYVLAWEIFLENFREELTWRISMKNFRGEFPWRIPIWNWKRSINIKNPFK